MNTHKYITEIKKSGIFTLKSIPFKKGQKVKVVVSKIKPPEDKFEKCPLEGMLKKYEHPFEPIILSK